jgi:hypothetical protein
MNKTLKAFIYAFAVALVVSVVLRFTSMNLFTQGWISGSFYWFIFKLIDHE